VNSLTSKLYRGGTAAGGATEPADKTVPGKDTNQGTSVFKVAKPEDLKNKLQTIFNRK